MEFKLLISRPGKVVEIFKNVKSHGKWKYTTKKRKKEKKKKKKMYWPNIKWDTYIILDGIEGCMRIYWTRHDDIHRAGTAR